MTLARELGPLALRYPDGETGERIRWIRWQRHVFDDNPRMKLVEEDHHPGYGSQAVARPFYRLVDGDDGRGLAFKRLGYATVAIQSYRVFAELKAAGNIPPGMRFQVSLPTAVSVLSSFVVVESRAAVEPAFEAALRADVEEMAAAIPAAQLAIQWDVASEVIAHDGGREVHYADILSGSADRIARQVGVVPAGVEVGIHLCYGDPGHKHEIEPADTATSVAFANAIVKRAPRPIDWVQLPIPRGWTEAHFYAPLAGLEMAPGTRLFVGLVHFCDGIDGTRRRIALARRHLDDFGIATECGFGRRDPATLARLFEIHRLAAAS